VHGTLAHDGAFLRRLAYLGARHGPQFWLKYSPPLFGVAFALALPGHRHKVRDTLRWVRGKAGLVQEQRELFATFISYAQCLAEALACERPEAARTRCHVEGEPFLQQALASGRGAIVLTAHAGPWDAAAARLAETAGREVIVVMQGEADERARAIHDGVRRRAGMRVVHVGEHPLDGLPLVHALKAGGLLAIQLDRTAPSGRGLPVRLFDREVVVPEGPFRLAQLARVPLLPLFVRRRGHFDYHLVVYPPIEVEPGAATLARAAQDASDAMARFIRECPTQWFNF
jgi:lauroyl/myristoyl acyltransferase